MMRHEVAKGAAVAAATVERRPFRIVNDFNGRCMEIHGGMARPGNHVVSFARRPGRVEQQLWYLDPHGHIHSMMMDYVLDCKRMGERLVVNPQHPGDRHQMWFLDGNRIICRDHPDRCVQIRMGEDRDDADIILHTYDRRPFQHWRFEFI